MALDHKNYPPIVKSSFEMTEPNETILLYIGEFDLRSKHKTNRLNGEIFFSWFPTPGPRFSGTVTKSEFSFIASDSGLEAIVDESKWGEVIVTEFHEGLEQKVSGRFVGRVLRGDKSIPVSKIDFVLPNFRGFSGSWVLDGSWVGRQRLVFEDDEFIIRLDKRREFPRRMELLKRKGGYIFLYNGEIVKKKKSITHEGFDDLRHSLLTFLSFLNGRRCCPLLIRGVHDDEVIWSDYTGYMVDDYKSVFSWAPTNEPEGLSNLWRKFSELWKDKNDRDFSVSAVHWYVEANSHSGFTEGAIMMAQTALELIYNWLIIEKLQLLSGKDCESISASNKIRLLVSHLQVPFDFPDSAQTLKKLSGTEGAPEAFVQLRNAIAHSQEEKRRKLYEMPGLARFEALQVGIWYTELALLKILDYKGKYRNRCSEITSPRTETVPWIKPIAGY